MTRGNVKINYPDRFKGNHLIAHEKLDAAIKRATEKLELKLDLYKTAFPQNMKCDGSDYKYYNLAAYRVAHHNK